MDTEPLPVHFNVTLSDVDAFYELVVARPEFSGTRAYLTFLASAVYFVIVYPLNPDSDTLLGSILGLTYLVGPISGLVSVVFAVGWIGAVSRYAAVKKRAPSPEIIGRVKEYLDARLGYDNEMNRLKREAEWVAYQLKEKERRRQEGYWRGLSAYAFEVEVQGLYERKGYRVHRTGGSGDEGVDLMFWDSEGKVVVQCKQHDKPLSPGAARDLLGTIIHHEARGGILVCTGGFSDATKSFARGKPITLVGLYDLMKMSDECRPPSRR